MKFTINLNVGILSVTLQKCYKVKITIQTQEAVQEFFFTNVSDKPLIFDPL